MWEIQQTDKGYEIYNLETTAIEGIHDNEDAAKEQLKALIASKDQADMVAVGGHKSYFVLDVKTVGEPTDPAGEFEAILSTPIIDRDGEIVDSKAFEPLPKSIPIHIDHDARYASLVARATPVYDGPVLKVRGVFSSSPLAQQVRQDVANGILDSMSVGFGEAQRKNIGGTMHVTKASLWEASFVTIPSNPEAMVLASKAKATPHYSDIDQAIAEIEHELNDYA